jgi:hypothetical protein
MRNNYEAFIALRDRYRSITIGEVEDVFDVDDTYESLILLTGYGNKKHCTLCIATLTEDEMEEGWDSNCPRCLWSIVTGSVCYDGDNADSYNAIGDASDADEVLDTFLDRADRMDEVIEEYNKSRESGRTLEEETLGMVAAFMGVEDMGICYYIPEHGEWAPIKHTYEFELKEHYKLSELKYNTSWDWLIPVIDKIYSSDEYSKYLGTLGQFNDGIFINTKYIQETFNDVVEYIKWNIFS